MLLDKIAMTAMSDIHPNPEMKLAKTQSTAFELNS
jgi:hypothetical protein